MTFLSIKMSQLSPEVSHYEKHVQTPETSPKTNPKARDVPKVHHGQYSCYETFVTQGKRSEEIDHAEIYSLLPVTKSKATPAGR